MKQEYRDGIHGHHWTRRYELDSGVIGLIAVGYIVLPIYIKQTVRINKNCSIKEFDPSKARLPPEVSDYFDDVTVELGGLGIDAERHFTVSNMVANVTAIFVMLANRAEGEAAIAIVAYGGTDESSVLIQDKQVEFVTEFTDGTEIETSNTQGLYGFKPVPRKQNCRLPKYHDLERLLAIHRFRVGRSEAGTQCPIPQPDDWADVIREDSLRESHHQIGVGILYETENEFQATWPGAYYMTWKQLWPMSFICKTIDACRAAKIESDFELSGALSFIHSERGKGYDSRLERKRSPKSRSLPTWSCADCAIWHLVVFVVCDPFSSDDGRGKGFIGHGGLRWCPDCLVGRRCVGWS
ncbi:MAG: hypothetical protein CMJ78_14525 [Planctomycetaceae bacterium]|nr:hypothetical protein [Planctomycetaceae bacterium]